MVRLHTNGFSHDHTFLISGLIELYYATFDGEYLKWADALQETQLQLFWDNTNGGPFRTPARARNVIIRMKDRHDTEGPSANSVSCMKLLRLGSMLVDHSYGKKAVAICHAFGQKLSSHPWELPGMLVSWLFAWHEGDRRDRQSAELGCYGEIPIEYRKQGFAEYNDDPPDRSDKKDVWLMDGIVF